jgi:hypothetical protein
MAILEFIQMVLSNVLLQSILLITTIYEVLKKLPNTVRSLDPKKRRIAIIALILLIFICPLFIPPTTPEFNESGGDTDTNGEYFISWKWSIGAISYTVEEALDPSFTNCEIVHSGIKREKCIYEKSTGIYFYRVKACNIVCESGWSTPKGINVSIPKKTTNGAAETTEAAKETTEAAKETTEAAKETTEAAKETTETAKETTEAAKETTEAAKETTEAAKETTEAAKETTEAAKETTEAANKTTEAANKTTEAANKTTEAANKTTETAKETTETAKETTEAAKETTEAANKTTDEKIGESTPVNATPTPTPNQRPRNATLETNLEEPQRTCTYIEWTASAIDPEGDELSYLFRTRGPATGNEWRDIGDWCFDNTWIWETSPDDIGDTDICVRIRDGYDEPPYLQDIYYDYTMKNDPPSKPRLTPNVEMPQKINETIPWTASATDPDGDTLFYLFKKKSPSNNQEIVRNWNTSNRWTWHTNYSDQGTSTIIVWIRDGYHNEADSFDCKAERSYPILPYLNFS